MATEHHSLLTRILSLFTDEPTGHVVNRYSAGIVLHEFMDRRGRTYLARNRLARTRDYKA
ncbi:hypothetical protein [Ruegeria sp. HKCCD6109]|uniref:hypothetical protein n=1 Tax=Ruegeria sp. HKCCD6109 TaxID=2683017 RepID=UPI00149201F2|nr:hypothetical protein [Ruegeria sp. HKCCD6109]NOD65759.1 hypothetical protein [Ruegeria sp. HKCCD6109]